MLIQIQNIKPVKMVEGLPEVAIHAFPHHCRIEVFAEKENMNKSLSFLSAGLNFLAGILSFFIGLSTFSVEFKLVSLGFQLLGCVFSNLFSGVGIFLVDFQLFDVVPDVHAGTVVEEEECVEHDVEGVDRELELPLHPVHELQLDAVGLVVPQRDQTPSVTIVHFHHLRHVRLFQSARRHPLL